MALIFLFAFLFGITIGSFLNVVVYRYNTGSSMVNDRSMCFSCGKKLEWYELLPLLSFIIQKGKCRKCGSTISWQYPLVEFVTGCMFVLLAYIFPPLTFLMLLKFVLYSAIWSILIVILVYDLRHKIIPDGLVFLFAGLSLIRLFISLDAGRGVSFEYPTLLSILAGPLLFLPFFMLWVISRGQWIGLGDGKLALGIGWLLGLSYGLSAIIIAFWLGALAGIILLVLRQLLAKTVFHRIALSLGLSPRIMKSEIPFAPFLILGTLIVFVWHIDVIGLSYFL